MTRKEKRYIIIGIGINSRMGKVRPEFDEDERLLDIKNQFPYGKGKKTKEEYKCQTTQSINSRMGKVRTVFCDTIEIIRFILYIVNTIETNYDSVRVYQIIKLSAP